MPSGLPRVLKALWQTGPLVILGLVCYFLSAFLDNFWYHAEDFMWLAPEGWSVYDMQLRMYTAANQIMRAIYCILVATVVSAFTQLVPVKSYTYGGVVLAACIWWVLAIAETFAVVQYILCKIVGDRQSIEMLRLLYDVQGTTSACDRFAGNLMEWGPLTISTIAILWILWRAYQVWRNQTQKPTDG
ncbi:MAG: hypothetical protein QNJ62_06585 [Methyloceanibacter sp.]|nr:hypothetical protein [Methyloceanibacter sp.]